MQQGGEKWWKRVKNGERLGEKWGNGKWWINKGLGMTGNGWECGGIRLGVIGGYLSLRIGSATS